MDQQVKKSPGSSWTLWFNGAMVALGIVEWLLQTGIIPAPPVITIVVAAVNFFLRFKTNKGISLKRRRRLFAR